MRLFITVDIDEEIMKKAVAVQQHLAGYRSLRLVRSKDLHFTLKFLGEVQEKELPNLKMRLAAVAERFHPFTVHVVGMGAFPDLAYMRVVWIGCPLLSGLQTAVEKEFSDFEKGKEGHPHMTIARVKNAEDREDILDHLREFEQENLGSMVVKEVKIKKSLLTEEGPVYSDVEGFTLK